MKKNNQPSILIFDSGVGGISVYKEIKQLLPDCHYLYCFDNAFFPYSEKSEEQIIQRALQICQKIHRTFALDLIVIACNTASTVVLPALRQHFDIPIVGTVPAVKPAAEISQTKTIGLLATKGTIKRQYVDDLIKNYASDCVVEKIGTTDLVEIVEEKQQTGKVDMARLQNIIAPWQQHPNLDTVILGCTHFPLVQQELQQLLPNIRYFIDPGNGIAKRVASLLEKIEIGAKDFPLINQAYYTAPLNNFEQRQKLMQSWGFERLELLE